MCVNILTFLIAICLFSFSSNIFAKQTGKIAIIIDDVGYNIQDKKLLTLPPNITFAILPFTPFSQEIANQAEQQDRNILLHLPMQAHANNHLLGAGALTNDMSKQQVQDKLNTAFNELPTAIGVNNHMGSELTEQITVMDWVMEALSKRGLFFVDSRTSAESIAEKSAVKAGLPALRRHIFLDNIKTKEAMNKQFQQAIKHSQESDYTIIIAHPYPETLHYLTERLNNKDKEFQLIPLTELIPEELNLLLKQKKVQYQQTNLNLSNKHNI